MIKKELKIGVKVEGEHSPTISFIKNYVKKFGKFPPNQKIFLNIAKNHLEEDSKYYTHLMKMEKKYKR